MNAELAGTAVLAALCGLLAGASSLRRRGVISAEVARKAVHVGMGSICVTFPWLFTDARAVVVLAAIAGAMLVAVRCISPVRARIGCALHDVGRASYGELAYIAGIVTLFVLAAGNGLVYVVPVVVLTLADPAAALIGMRCARHRFPTHDGSKSIGGSLAFFTISAICATTTLFVAGRTHALAAGLIVSTLLTLIEASAWAGLDNFTILFAGGVVMRALPAGIP